MKRRQFLAAAVAVASTRVAFAQKTPVVGLLWNDSVKPSPYAETLMGALRELGYTAGRSLRVDDRTGLEGYSGLPASAAQLAQARVDVIVTYGVTATSAAAKATKEIPIAAVIGADPVANGLAASFSRPGGNVTGVYTLGAAATRKRIELLKELIPDLSRLGLLIAPANLGSKRTQTDVDAAAKALKMQLYVREVRTPADVETAAAGFAKDKVGGVYVSGATMLAAHSQQIASAMAKYRVPAAYAVERYIDAGGLMVYSPSVSKAFVRVAAYVDRILKGSRPADMPIEQVTDVQLVLNLKTARTLGLRVPPAILQRADRAIQ